MFKAIGGLGNISSILSNLHNIGPKMHEVVERMREERITASAGEGAVAVTINGLGEMLQLDISEDAREEPELNVWIIEAANTAGSTAKRRYADAVRQAADELNLNLPGLDAILASLTGEA